MTFQKLRHRPPGLDWAVFDGKTAPAFRFEGRLGAMSAIRLKGELQDYYTRKVGEGKNKMLVLNAVRNNGTAEAAHPSGLLGGRSR